MVKQYTTPKVSDLGSLKELTAENKCGGSADATFPQILFPPTNEGCPPGP
jgi:hypothetical protein